MSDYWTAEKEFRPLGLTTRTINALVAREIYSVRDLAALTEFDLSVMQGVGEKAFSQLKIFVQKKAAEIPDRPRAVSAIFPPETLTAIDAWAGENSIPSRSAAVRSLVELGLKAKISK